jgi:O-antigen/teichoic acid export membrane protein
MMLSAAQALVVAAGYAVHAVSSRALDPADYGRFVVALSIAGWAKVLLAAFLVPGMSKIVSEEHARLGGVLRRVGQWHALTALVAAALFILAAPRIALAFGDEDLTVLLRIVGMELPAWAALALWTALLSSILSYGDSAMLVALYGIGRLVGAWLLVGTGFGVVGATVGVALGSFAAGGAGALLIRRARRALAEAPCPGAGRRTLAWAAVSLPSALGMVTLSTLDLWLVKALLADAALTGIYGAAFTISRVPSFLVHGVLGVIFPRISHALASRNTQLSTSIGERSLRLLLLVFLPLNAIGLACAPEVLASLLGPRYAAAAGILSLLLPAVTMLAAMKVLFTMLAAADQPGRRLVCVSALLPVHIAASFLMIRVWGMHGAALASLLVLGAGAATGFVMVRHALGVAFPLRTLVTCLAAGLAVWGAGSLWTAPGIVLAIAKAAVLSLVYLALLAIMRELRAEDIATARQLLPLRFGGAGRKSPPRAART